MPKKQKYRKMMRGKMKGLSTSGFNIDFGEYALKSLGRGYLNSNQIESARKTITNTTKRSGKVWIRIFPDKPITKKALGVRMGSGKGAVDHFSAVIKPGRILFEISGVTEDMARECFRKAGHKMPFRTKFVKKEQ